MPDPGPSLSSVSNLPEPVQPHRPAVHPALVRAAVSPTAVAAAAVGAGIGVLDRSAVVAAALAVVGWTGRMLAAVVGQRRRQRAARPRPAEMDPWSVPEPWRQLLQQALSAQTRFDQAVAAWPPGPTRDRLTELQPRVYQEVAQLGATARQGAAAAGWNGGTFPSGRPSSGELKDELARIQADRVRLGDSSPARSAELGRREEAVAAQLRSVHRAQQAQAAIHDRLRLAVARLDETVTDLLTVEIGAVGQEPSGLSSALDELSDGITTLRAALTETTGTPPESGTP